MVSAPDDPPPSVRSTFVLASARSSLSEYEFVICLPPELFLRKLGCFDKGYEAVAFYMPLGLQSADIHNLELVAA
jgi:hypothetical protein